MKNKVSMLITNLIALTIFMLIHFALYYETFNFWQAFLRGLGLLVLFNVFNWWFSGKKKKK
ncbi:MAG: hypothetical protein ACOC4G_01860 [Bacillota bacterium]